ncbi:polyhydroxyalkanoate synthesis repressor PhaR [Ferruginivarius sediminum]|uniref:Polyhydroxyalkanoate synthesis repressor PhaR n=1 Tax=Ferruginivarius sediminum TaxID=2661937 RepID=A0A369TDX0_9PROT|nr:polyhydroxyalkanoate synthesis repressor PhaR [Ferruginivarius sediminum]RDD63470.1 polyhydroxyalkanoate synthesis repressor PhaR [Ferruginivarius sediminum]
MARDEQNEPRGGRSGRTQGPIVIKKYANRRLYNTATSSYVTLDHLCQMVKDDFDFVVYDAKTGEDITRSVLTQIIVEEESKGTNLLPITFLRQLISFYGHSMQGLVPRYLEHMMGAFAANQDRLRQQMQETMSGMFPFGSNLEEMSRQNAALMESAMKMFSPFGVPPTQDEEGGGHAQGESEPESAGGEQGQAGENGGEDESLAQLKRQVDLLQQQLDDLAHRQQDSEDGEPKPGGKAVAQGKRRQGSGSS